MCKCVHLQEPMLICTFIMLGKHIWMPEGDRTGTPDA
jgi:hypothetical protein